MPSKKQRRSIYGLYLWIIWDYCIDLQKEEVKRRKQVTEKMMQSGKKSLAELLSD